MLKGILNLSVSIGSPTNQYTKGNFIPGQLQRDYIAIF